MKTECRRTRQALPKYLSGHLFKTSKNRISRHLQQCVVCRSEFEALKRVEETRLLLRDINAPEDIAGRVREGVSSLGKMKKLLYRPLWIAGLLLLAFGVYYYIVTPKQLDIEIERIVKTAPSSTATIEPNTLSGASVSASPTPLVSAAQTATAVKAAVAAVPAPDPLVIAITPENDTTAVRRINEVMSGHGSLRAAQFSETTREASGSLTAKELLTLFNRIEATAKVSFSRKRFDAFPAGQPIAFILQLKRAPKAAEAPTAPTVTPKAPAPQPATKPEVKPAQPVSPSVPETAPTPSAVQ